jgi:hypothetical protein
MQELFRWHCPKFGHALCSDCFTSYSEDFSKIAVKVNIGAPVYCCNLKMSIEAEKTVLYNKLLYTCGLKLIALPCQFRHFLFMLKKLTFLVKKYQNKAQRLKTFEITLKTSKIWFKTLVFGQKLVILCGVGKFVLTSDSDVFYI